MRLRQEAVAERRDRLDFREALATTGGEASDIDTTRTADAISDGIAQLRTPSIYDAYNSATWVATHQRRRARTAFALLARINLEFQTRFPGH